MKVEIRKIQEGDIEFVRANPFEEKVKCYPDMKAPDDSYTIVFDGEIVAVGGIIETIPGVIEYPDGHGELWLMLTKQARKEGIFGLIALNAIEKTIDKLVKDHNIRTAIACVRTDFSEAIKMVKAFGFKKDRIKETFTPDGCDLIIFHKNYE